MRSEMNHPADNGVKAVLALLLAMITLTLVDRVAPGVVPFWLPVIILPILTVGTVWVLGGGSAVTASTWAVPVAIALVIADAYLPYPVDALAVASVYSFLIGSCSPSASAVAG
jgi:hypothetical protein